MKALVLITQVGINLATPIVLCALLGSWIDKRVGTKWIFSVIFILLGIASGFLSTYRLIMAFNKSKKEEEKVSEGK